MITKFAPEALGFYEDVDANSLGAEKPSLQKNVYDFVKNQRDSDIGIFHHGIELLAAKYDKVLVCPDLEFSKSPEEYFKDGTDSRSNSGDKPEYKVGIGAVLVAEGSKNKKMNRRSFLKIGAAAAVGVEVIGIAMHKGGKNNTRRDMPFVESYDPSRDIVLAMAILDLIKKYQKICLIYGSGHLPVVEWYLQNPVILKDHHNKRKDAIQAINNDPVKTYKFVPGQNKSLNAFIASKEMVWERQGH